MFRASNTSCKCFVVGDQFREQLNDEALVPFETVLCFLQVGHELLVGFEFAVHACEYLVVAHPADLLFLALHPEAFTFGDATDDGIVNEAAVRAPDLRR